MRVLKAKAIYIVRLSKHKPIKKLALPNIGYSHLATVSSMAKQKHAQLPATVCGLGSLNL